MAPRFEDLIERHHDEIFAYLWRLLGKQQRRDVTLQVEDLVQDVFLRAYEAYSNLRHDSNYRAWLYKIATNRAFAKLRQVKRRSETNTMLFNLANPDDNRSARTDLDKRLQLAVNQLPLKQKACVTLRYLSDLDYCEIAARVGCSEVSARANVSQAIRRLRGAFQEEE
jgi:RNA polymerase sigma-70 factor (ECF subfamily)